jgi:paraquat-inducible protein B
VDPTDPAGGLPAARLRRSRWIGLVWAVPLAALIIVAFLGVRALAERGVEVVVTFDSGAGARVDDTKVIYQGVEAGRVTAIDINQDGHHVDMTLLLDPRSEPGLTTTTTFWLIGANPRLNDLSSVKAAVAGLTIGVAPGIGGTPTRRFKGLSEPPVVLPGTPGKSYLLSCDTLSTTRVGSSIYFRGQEVGRVTAVKYIAPTTFKLEVFVFAPYDDLVRSSALFWVANPIELSLTDKGASATLEHASALFSGAIEIDLPDPAAAAPPSAAGTEFPLYPSRKEAEAGPSGPQLPYAFSFSGMAGEISEGAPVRLLGYQIGAVKSTRLRIDPQTGIATTKVVALLYPQKLQVPSPADAASAAAWRAPTDAVIARLLAQGHRAQLVQKPPLIGGRIITFDRVAGAPPAALGGGEPRLIPSAEAAGGIDELGGQASQLLARLNRVPFDSIGNEVQQVAARLNRLVSSPQLGDSVQRLDDTLKQAQLMLAELRPQVGPLLAQLNRAADQLTQTATAARGLLSGEGGSGAAVDASLPDAIREFGDAARSIRALADYLGRHPESLVRGRGGNSTDAGPATGPGSSSGSGSGSGSSPAPGAGGGTGKAAAQPGKD